MKNRIILFITIIVCFLLQCTVMDRISIGSITPNLLLILCVSMGLMRGRKVGLWTGFFSGLFVDLFYGSLFGFYALIYMYIGFISGYAFRSFYDDDLKVPLFLVAGTDLLYNLAVYGLQFLLRGRLGFSHHCAALAVSGSATSLKAGASAGSGRPAVFHSSRAVWARFSGMATPSGSRAFSCCVTMPEPAAQPKRGNFDALFCPAP